MEIEGMIIRDLGETGGTSKAGNQWLKHEWVMETMGQYPRKVKFHVFGEKSKTLTFEPGKSYILQFDLESREFNDRWYTDVSVYAARPADQTNPQGGGTQQQFGPTTSSGQPTNPYGNQQAAFQQPQAPAGNPFGGAAEFSQGDNTEDLPF